MPLFNGKYRTESNRMPGWDYSRNGYYFITPVVLGFHCYFGIIKNGEMILSEMGKIANDERHKSFEIRHELILDEYILMPNHLHAIIIIKNPDNEKKSGESGESPESKSPHAKFHRPPKSISSFMASFKSASTSKIDDYIDDKNLAIKKFTKQNRLWQMNYHDHIIRSDDEYRRIKNYIKNNPENWDEDKLKI
jgi:REP element-mobilizing transposase RayT